MGFLDKLLGSAGSEVLNKLKDAANSAMNSATNSNHSSANARPAQSNGPSVQQSSGSSSATSGDSWGPTMPAEENQYNYNGPYDQYFMDIYVQRFPTYRLTHEKVRKGSATVFTFWKGMTQEKALIVELMSDSSSAESIRNGARKEGVPYLRFYYNHEGWWNTKSYVIRRTQEALSK